MVKMKIDTKDFRDLIFEYELKISHLENKIERLEQQYKIDLDDLHREYKKDSYFNNGDTQSI